MVKKWIRKLITKKRERTFIQKAEVGKNVKFATSSHCVNSGPKTNITIGTHGCCFGGFQALCGGKISIGDNFYIGSGTYIQAKEQITIGDNVIISNDVLIVDNNNHPTEPEERLKLSQCQDYMNDRIWTWENSVSAPVVISDNTWIGKGAVILKGVTVGKGAIVGMRAVVTHDVPDYAVVAGNPATVVKRLKEAGENER